MRSRIVILCPLALAFAAPFQSGSLVALRVSNLGGVLTGAGSYIFIDELTAGATGGTRLQSIAVPSSGSAICTASGTQVSMGTLSLSPDGQRIAFGCFNASIGVAATTPGLLRQIQAVNADGTLGAPISSPGAWGTSGTTRLSSAIAVDGAGTCYGGGTAAPLVGYVSPSGVVTQISTITGNKIAIWNGTLFTTLTSGSNHGVYQLGSTGVLPTASAATTLITSTAAPWSALVNLPSSFVFQNATALWLCDVSATFGGIWLFTGAAFPLSSVPSGVVWNATVCSDVTGQLEGGVFVLYFVGGNVGAVNAIYRMPAVAPYVATPIAFSNASYGNDLFRGVALAPVLVTPTATVTASQTVTRTQSPSPSQAATATRTASPGAALQVSPAFVAMPTASVNLSWSGIGGAASTDWIAFYCAGAAVGAFGPWAYVNALCAGWATGGCSGVAWSISYLASNMECTSFEMRYYRNPSPYTLVVTSNNLSWVPPLQVSPSSLFVAAPITSITLSWSGIAGAVSTDWIAWYCVGAATTSYGTWAYVSALCTGWATGGCTGVVWNVSYSVCCNCAQVSLRYYRNPSPYTFIAASNALTWYASYSQSVTPSLTTTPSTTQTASSTSTSSVSGTLTPTPSSTQTATVSTTATSSSSLTATATITAGSTGTSSVSQTPSATQSATSTISSSQALTASMTQSSSLTQSASETQSASLTISGSLTTTSSLTLSCTQSDSGSQAGSPSQSTSRSASGSPTQTSTAISTPSSTHTQTGASTSSSSATAASTLSETQSLTQPASFSQYATQTTSTVFTLTPTPSITSTATPSAMPSPSQTPSASPSNTQTQTQTISQVATASITASSSAMSTVAQSPSQKQTASTTQSASCAPSGSQTLTFSQVSSGSVTATVSQTGTPSQTQAATASQGTTATASGTSSEAATPSMTATQTVSSGLTRTATPSQVSTPSSTPSVSSSQMITPSQTGTASPTESPSLSGSPSVTATPTTSSSQRISASQAATMSQTMSAISAPETTTATGSGSSTPLQAVTASPTEDPSQQPSGSVSAAPTQTPSVSQTTTVSQTSTTNVVVTATPSQSSRVSSTSTASSAALFLGSFSATPSTTQRSELASPATQIVVVSASNVASSLVAIPSPSVADTAECASPHPVVIRVWGGVTAAVILEPSVGLQLRLDFACALGVAVRCVLITALNASSVVIPVDRSAAVNVAAGDCSALGNCSLSQGTSCPGSALRRQLLSTGGVPPTPLDVTLTVGLPLSAESRFTSLLALVDVAPPGSGPLGSFVTVASQVSGLALDSLRTESIALQAPSNSSSSGGSSSAGGGTSQGSSSNGPIAFGIPLIIGIAVGATLLLCALLALLLILRCRRRRMLREQLYSDGNALHDKAARTPHHNDLIVSGANPLLAQRRGSRVKREFKATRPATQADEEASASDVAAAAAAAAAFGFEGGGGTLSKLREAAVLAPSHKFAETGPPANASPPNRAVIRRAEHKSTESPATRFREAYTVTVDVDGTVASQANPMHLPEESGDRLGSPSDSRAALAFRGGPAVSSNNKATITQRTQGITSDSAAPVPRTAVEVGPEASLATVSNPLMRGTPVQSALSRGGADPST